MHSDGNMARAYIGTSGWLYPGWRPHLYGATPVARWLEVASRTFNSLEINNAFYTQIAPDTYRRWYAQTPQDFRFALKGHRYVTHFKRLRDCADSIARLHDQVRPLREKLAAVVWQLPSRFACDLDRLDGFVRELGAWRGARHALELRHRSWFTPAVARVLSRAEVAVCMSDAPDFPLWDEVTTDLVYVRLHGHTRKYASGYSRASLASWAAKVRRWLARGLDVCVYFDNDAEGHAVKDALRLRSLLDGSALPAVPVAAHSRPGDAEAGRAAPSRRPTARPRVRAPSGHRSTARTGSREPRRAGH
jgi:uncharacterized protein YecE (DUF72 family)